MNKLITMYTNGDISLSDAYDLIDLSNLISDGITACRNNIRFSIGENSRRCYYYSNADNSWYGDCTHDGVFMCHPFNGSEIGKCDITNSKEMLLAFENEEFAPHLKRFLKEQIEKAKQ